jgi:hypothetical protein
MIVSVGINLPKGTVVYYRSYELQGYSDHCYPVRGVINPYDHFIHKHYAYQYDPRDGLWATYVVRNFWRDNPEFHPHNTLFSILYEKLEI